MDPDASTSSRAGPLTGMRVLEMGSTVAGPFCGRLLADFGAEVIKIEPAEGDPVRTMGKHFDGKSLYAASIFRNKRLISRRPARARGPATSRASSRARATWWWRISSPARSRSWGLGYERPVARQSAAWSWCASRGFGQDGPYATRPGYGVICEAVSGLRHLTGDPDRPPSRVAVSMTDYITGLHAAFGAVDGADGARAHRAGPVRRRGALRMRLQLHGAVDPGLREARPCRQPHRLAPRREHAQQSLSRPATASSSTSRPWPTASFAAWPRRWASRSSPRTRASPRRSSATATAKPRRASSREWTTTQPLAEIERKLEAAGVPATRIYHHRRHLQRPALRARGARSSLRRTSDLGIGGDGRRGAEAVGDARRDPARGPRRRRRTRAPCCASCSAMAADDDRAARALRRDRMRQSDELSGREPTRPRHCIDGETRGSEGWRRRHRGRAACRRSRASSIGGARRRSPWAAPSKLARRRADGVLDARERVDKLLRSGHASSSRACSARRARASRTATGRPPTARSPASAASTAATSPSSPTTSR